MPDITPPGANATVGDNDSVPGVFQELQAAAQVAPQPQLAPAPQQAFQQQQFQPNPLMPAPNTHNLNLGDAEPQAPLGQPTPNEFAHALGVQPGQPFAPQTAQQPADLLQQVQQQVDQPGWPGDPQAQPQAPQPQFPAQPPVPAQPSAPSDDEIRTLMGEGMSLQQVVGMEPGTRAALAQRFSKPAQQAPEQAQPDLDALLEPFEESQREAMKKVLEAQLQPLQQQLQTYEAEREEVMLNAMRPVIAQQFPGANDPSRWSQVVQHAAAIGNQVKAGVRPPFQTLEQGMMAAAQEVFARDAAAAQALRAQQAASHQRAQEMTPQGTAPATFAPQGQQPMTAQQILDRAAHEIFGNGILDENEVRRRISPGA